MGYLLKTNEETLMFYSKPERGYYRGERTCISLDDYPSYEKDNLTEDMVWVENKWYDVTNAFSEIATGVKVDGFVIDCILQGGELHENEPYAF